MRNMQNALQRTIVKFFVDINKMGVGRGEILCLQKDVSTVYF